MEYVMKYNFDEAVERRGTGCLKYDFAKERGKKEDVLPLWVADMDFKTAPAVTERLQKVVEHGIYVFLYFRLKIFKVDLIMTIF